MTGIWGWIVTAFSVFIGLFRNIPKYFRLVAWENSLFKRERDVTEEKRRLQHLVSLQDDNKSKIRDLIKLEIERVRPRLAEPSRYVEVTFRITNHSIFDVALVGLSSTVKYETHSTGIEIQYTGKVEISRQNSAFFNRQFPISDDFAKSLRDKQDQKQVSYWQFPAVATFEWPFEPFKKEGELSWEGV